MNTMNGPVVGCEIELRNGQFCGVQAIGRCATCGRAFCLTHQGRYYDNFRQLVPYVDMCAPCAAVKQAEEAKRQQEAEAPREYFESGAARTALLTARVPPVDIYTVSEQWKSKKGLFGRSGYVNVATPVGRGWILGEFKWEYSVGVPGAGFTEHNKVVENGLTALMDDDQISHLSGRNHGLVRVQPCSGGYEVLGGSFVGDEAWARHRGEAWREIAQAVKRLIGESI